ncbi:hypothetical protein HYFRA_00013802 [Hymenoscyphus fraxineus]|uniref:Uncharacterized protein n=1 Tax=Hymenoscyphus fraxineus TaxID=746836 RepID=A0A9N9PVG7_9HELO|nr:hypothetical protein HYFRA_00013802 [Hymenoscyphus fraxineus]
MQLPTILILATLAQTVYCDWGSAGCVTQGDLNGPQTSGACDIAKSNGCSDCQFKDDPYVPACNSAGNLIASGSWVGWCRSKGAEGGQGG